MIAIGTQAIAGIGRSTSATGKMISCTSFEAAHDQAERHADDARARSR
jgi:hypothetical protein